MMALHVFLYAFLRIHLVQGTSASQFIQAADHFLGVVVSGGNDFSRRKCSEAGPQVQQLCIVEPTVIALRNVRSALSLITAEKGQRLIAFRELQKVEDGLIKSPRKWYHKAPEVLQALLSADVRASAQKLALAPARTAHVSASGQASAAPSRFLIGSSIREAVVDLGGGQLMPLLGFGTGIMHKQLDAQKVVEVVRYAAAEAGYRHFDCAQAYNLLVTGTSLEQLVGQGLKASGVPRKELFIATKLSRPRVLRNIAKEMPGLIHDQMQKLGTDYLDLYMFHSKIANKEREKEAWRALEKLHKAGVIHALGLSNYGIEEIKRILSFAEVKPVYLQIRYDVYHPGYSFAHAGQENVVSWAQSQGITVLGYSTLSGWPNKALPTVKDPYVTTLASKYKKTSAQLLLRHSLQKGVAVIPKSTDPGRMKANTEIFDFEISAEDMVLIDGLAHFASLAGDGSPHWIPDVYGARAEHADAGHEL